MPFQIHALPKEPFAPFFVLSDDELAERGARRMTVRAKPGTPCRISLADAEIGETVILLNHTHQPHDTPFRASHAIFVRENAETAEMTPGEIPEVLRSRLISVRSFDTDHMMIDADAVDGAKLDAVLESAFENPDCTYIHLHYAKPGCFAATVTRA